MKAEKALGIGGHSALPKDFLQALAIHQKVNKSFEQKGS